MESESAVLPLSLEEKEKEFLFQELGGGNDEDIIMSHSRNDTDSDESPDSEWENNDLIDPERVWTPEGTLLDIPYTGPAQKITFNLPKNLKTPMDYFNLFFNDEFMTLIVESININGLQIFLNNTFAKKHFKKWKTTNRDEVKTFLGMLFHLGIVKYPVINEFWNGDDPTLWHKPPFEDYIGEERFMMLLRALMFRNKISDSDKGAPYSKTKPFVDFFNEMMSKLATPGEDVVLHKFYAQWPDAYDVARFKHRRQFGFKLFLLNDPIGFTYKIILWCNSHEIEWDKKVEQALDIMTQDYLDCGRTIYMSDIFCKPEFVEKLLQKKTYVTSSIDLIFVPAPEKIQKFLKKSKEDQCLYNKNMCIFKSDHLQKRYVFSSKHTNEKAKESDKECKNELEVNQALNRNFAHIESRLERLSDYTNGSYHLFTNAILHIINIMFLNAYIVYKDDNQEVTMSYRQFRMIISGLFLGKEVDSDMSFGSSDSELSGSGSSYDPPSFD